MAEYLGDQVGTEVEQLKTISMAEDSDHLRSELKQLLEANGYRKPWKP